MLADSPFSTFKMKALILLLTIVLNPVDSCTFPANLVGSFLDSTKGLVTFNSTNLNGYPISNLGNFDFSCYQSTSNQYILQSDSFRYFELTWRAYLCWDVTEVATDQFLYYERSDRLSDAGNERVKMYLEGFTVNTAEVCALSSGINGTYKYLLKNDSLSTVSTTCPTALQSYFNYTVDFGASDTCSNDTTQFGSCADSSALTFNYTGCSTPLAYSDTGTVHCLYNLVANNLNYLTVLNKQHTVGQNNSYYFTCLVMDTSNPSVISATQYPQQCQDNQTSTYVRSPGAALVFTYSDPCVQPTTTTTATTTADPGVSSATSVTTITIASVLTILGIILILIVILCYVSYTKEIEANQRRIEDKRAQDTVDGRYNEDDDMFGERGKPPPHLRITFPDYTKRTNKHSKVGVETSYGFDDWDGVDHVYNNGLIEPVTPSGVFPRTMDEKANREERMSNDSALGMEEDDIPPIAGTPEVRTNHEVQAFRKIHGRQDFKSEAALVSINHPMNLVKKIKKFAKKKKRRPSDIYQSKVGDLETGHSNVNYVRGIGRGSEGDRGKDNKRRNTQPDNQYNADDVDTAARQSDKRIRQDNDINSMLAGSVLDSLPRYLPKGVKASKGVHYSPRSPGVIMEDLEDQVSKKYTEGFVSTEQDQVDPSTNRSTYIYTENEKDGTTEKIPVTPNMKIRRYENKGEDMDPSLSDRNQSTYFQRLNRKGPKKAGSKSAGSPINLPDLRRPGMSEDQYRRLLEELYPDKKYFDYTKQTSLPTEEHLAKKSGEGLEYLHGVAEYWGQQEPVKRPQSTPNRSRGPRSARTPKTAREGSGFSRNRSFHTPEVTNQGMPPDVS